MSCMYACLLSQAYWPCIRKFHSIGIRLTLIVTVNWQDVTEITRCSDRYRTSHHQTDCDELQSVCPIGWRRLGETLKCKSPPDYLGPCRYHWISTDVLAGNMPINSGAASGIADFLGFNRDMLNYWSSSCGAHWQCESLPGVTIMHEFESSWPQQCLADIESIQHTHPISKAQISKLVQSHLCLWRFCCQGCHIVSDCSWIAMNLAASAAKLQHACM